MHITKLQDPKVIDAARSLNMSPEQFRIVCNTAWNVYNEISGDIAGLGPLKRGYWTNKDIIQIVLDCSRVERLLPTLPERKEILEKLREADYDLLCQALELEFDCDTYE